MIIAFYIKNEEEIPITTFYDIESNPFSVGDILNLNVDDIYPIQINKYDSDYQKKIVEDNTKLIELFKRKKIKIVEEGKWVEFSVLNSSKLTIEYHCQFVD
jgi:hypothetical protein